MKFRHVVTTCVLAACVVAAVPAIACPPAGARVRIDRDRIVVTAEHAKAVVDRRPFRLRIKGGDGTVLKEVGNTGQQPLRTPPTIDPTPPGFDNQQTPTLYAPLGFLVGNETVEQYDGGLWGGNPISGERSGTQYSARDVQSAGRKGGRARLIVSTSDPSGRTLEVTLKPVGCCAISVTVKPHPDTGIATMGDSFSSGTGEGFFGFGGRHNALDQRGRALSSFVEEENANGLQAWGKGGGGLSLFPNGPAAAYYPQAEFTSSRGYGFLLSQPQLARFKLDSDTADAWNVSASAHSLRYVVAPGEARRAIRTLTALTGRQPVPPRWALGPMFDRLVKNFGETESDYEANLRADLRDIQRYHLPLTAYRIEGWGFPGGNDGIALHTYTSPGLQRHVIATLRRRGIHSLVYLRPWIEPGSGPVRKGWVATHADGSPYYTTGTAGQRIALLDFTNPRAVRYWRQRVAKALDTGADGFMADFGEEVLFGMHFADGTTGKTMHDKYLTLYAKATREAIDAYERRHPGRRAWFFTRAGYTGRPGSAAYEGGNFPGDETTDWTHSSGLASLTADMLNRAIGGAYGYGTDIGGYFDYTTPPTTKPLFLRWAEWAALSPVFRLHGSGRSGTHAPWTFDAQTVRVYDRLSRLHLAAVPLIMRLWRHAEHTGIPPTRPLWLEDPSDHRARHADQEWMLGRNLLAAPVVVSDATTRSVFFPHGCWRSPSGKRYAGPGSATVQAPLTRLPYFRRCGTHPLTR
jgi:alpha-glucosidase (family GH31 glycosyl hydrolase)